MEAVYDIVLASASPRRKQLLEDAGISFSVVVSQANEDLPDEAWADPAQAVQLLAERKAQAVASTLDVQAPTLVIGADTIVVVDGVVYGKPADVQQARQMLQTMSGRAHQVMTGVSVWKVDPAQSGSQCASGFVEVSDVHFKPLTSQDIDLYLACGESLDKAGAYAIQGEGHVLVERFEGDYDNIVGLPVSRLMRELQALGAR